MVNTSPNHRVTFGPEAWALRCECSSGAYIITFDVDLESIEVSKGKQRIILNPGIMLEGSQANLVADAQLEKSVLAAVEQHLRSVGYEVIRYKA